MKWQAVARRLGLRVVRRKLPKKLRSVCPWSGEALYSLTGGAYVRDYWHEIGHFLVAPGDGLHLRGWGMGMVYDLTDGGPLIEGDPADEPDASAVGVWAQLVLGKDAEGAEVHAVEHSWGRFRIGGYGPISAVEEYLARIGPGGAGHKPEVCRRVSSRLTGAGFPVPW